MGQSMKAIVVDAPGGLEVLQYRSVPIPEPGEGEILVRMRAVAINAANILQQEGTERGVTYPRILGFDCVGEVARDPSGRLPAGTRVIVCFEVGRYRDGGYAEYVNAPAEIVRPFFSTLDWPTLSAGAGSFIAASSALFDVCPPMRPGQTILIRGGTTGVGLAAANIAKAAGLHVISTTRDPEKASRLQELGIVDEVFVGSDRIASQVGRRVDLAIQMLGLEALEDTLQCMVPFGTVCNTGTLGGRHERYGDKVAKHPMAMIPHGIRFTTRKSDNHGGHARVQEWVDGLASGKYRMPVDKVFSFDQMREAHAHRASFKGFGKVVVEID